MNLMQKKAKTKKKLSNFKNNYFPMTWSKSVTTVKCWSSDLT